MKDQELYYENKLKYETDSADLFDALDKQENVRIIDARSAGAYETEHIPGAISLPHRTMSPESTVHLDKENLYIVYCDGIGCNASVKGALKMLKLGFRVKELLGGLDWWKRDGYETEGTNASPGTEVKCAC